MSTRSSRLLWTGLAVLATALGCLPSTPPAASPTLVPPWVGQGPTVTPAPPATPTPGLLDQLIAPTRMPGEEYLTPTPDPVRTAPPLRTETVTYIVRPGDSLSQIAERFGIGPNLILEANGIANPDLLGVGQLLTVPPPLPQAPGPGFKIIPDSELVYGPAAAQFDAPAFVAWAGGYLSRYSEEVEGELVSGGELVQRVAELFSVNPRLLLAVLEHQSGWVTRADVDAATLTFPMGYVTLGYEGLISQLSWAADELNTGYYRWRSGWAGPYVLLDGSTVLPGPGLNAGTAAVQQLFSRLYGVDAWRQAVDSAGVYETYNRLFGIPFDRRVEPLLPPDLQQPALQLPFEDDATWSFTSGPHGGYGTGSAWAALDFAPPGDALGCVSSDAWVTAAADGLVVRSGQGEVVIDLDGDGFEQTGWTLYYLHLETRDRIPAGSWVRAGWRLGHPSCEGGISSGTHVHLARKYNGEWIPATADPPFVMDGWVSGGSRLEYDGTMSRDGVVLWACACRSPENQIAR